MEKQKNAHRLVQLALLVAVELVMTYTPLGYLHVGPLSTYIFNDTGGIGGYSDRAGRRRGVGRRIRPYQFRPVLWCRGLWRCFAGHQPPAHVFSMRAHAHSGGLAARADFPGHL